MWTGHNGCSERAWWWVVNTVSKQWLKVVNSAMYTNLIILWYVFTLTSNWFHTMWRHNPEVDHMSVLPHTFNIGARIKWIARFMPRPLYLPWQTPWYPLNKKQCGPQSQLVHSGEDKNFMPQPGINPWLLRYPVRRAIVVSIPTEFA
jgi:hypothetical protein